MTVIDDYAFYGCDSLKAVYFSGSEEQWEGIDKGYYGNNALDTAHIYYNGELPPPEPTPIPLTEVEITKEETDTAYTFTITPETAYESCFVYAAIYDADGILQGVNRVPLQMTGSTSVSVNKQENGVTAKVFVWSDFLQSIIEHAEEFDL